MFFLRTDLPGVPPDKDFDFSIDLETGTKSISIPPYHMALTQLKGSFVPVFLHRMLLFCFLTYAPAVFMEGMNEVFWSYLDSFVLVFIDDILVYPKNKEDHDRHLRIMLQRLGEEKLYAKFLKCEFWLDSVAFLGHVVSNEGISVALAKIEAVRCWTRPTSVIKIRVLWDLQDITCDLFRAFPLLHFLCLD
ncbi:hypothetical protein MTR67_044064 [Solanum verrucosum]|uniref:Reverse transcriptase domain-containing protein n=1 Tax=Solanum verrucosum TaxID=315347 RepID=A0AAF0URJ3_SOLVR|nr:hypothetical protein MTR67_044064 [Solanum verrucosum]